MFGGFPPNYKKSFSIVQRNDGAVEAEEMIVQGVGDRVGLLICGPGIMLVPIVYIDQARVGLVMRRIVRAFYDILAPVGNGYDGTHPAVLTGKA